MDYSRKISERLWNRPEKGELESRREEIFIDDIIQKSHIEKELLSHLDGIKTVFDGGAGCGRFSILLAKKGCAVTHFDISQPMIDKAKELAAKAGVLDKITFVKGALEELKSFNDKSFDMVISFDAPISYTYPNQNGSMSILWTKKVERLCCFFEFLILLLLRCHITNCTMDSFAVIPALYIFKDCPAGFL